MDELIEKLRILQSKNSLSLYKREVCRDAADAIERLVDERDKMRDQLILNAEKRKLNCPIKGELVRCGECKHRYVDGDNVRYNVCELNHNKVQSDDWFCADGERRGDE